MTPAARGDLQSLPLRTAPHPPYSNYEASNYLLSWLSPAGTLSPATRKRPGRSTVLSRARPSPSAGPPRCPSRRSPVRLRRVRLPGSPAPPSPRRVSPRLPAQPPTHSAASASSQRPPAPSPAAAAAPALPAAEAASRIPRYGPR